MIVQIGSVICVSDLGEIEGNLMKKGCTELAAATKMRIDEKESIETDLPTRFF